MGYAQGSQIMAGLHIRRVDSRCHSQWGFKKIKKAEYLEGAPTHPRSRHGTRPCRENSCETQLCFCRLFARAFVVADPADPSGRLAFVSQDAGMPSQVRVAFCALSGRSHCRALTVAPTPALALALPRHLCRLHCHLRTAGLTLRILPQAQKLEVTRRLAEEFPDGRCAPSS